MKEELTGHIMHSESKTPSVNEMLDAERAEHNELYAELGRRAKEAVTLTSYKRKMAYPWSSGWGLYSEEIARFASSLEPYIRKASLKGYPVLDYACGIGDFSCYLALMGCREVHGFDLSARGVETGQRLAADSGLADQVHLETMNAQQLRYEDNQFGLIAGKGVLHHVLKYPNTAREIHRVLGPGGRAVFLENLGNGPIWRWIRKKSIGGTELGDINLDSEMIKTRFQEFRSCTINGFHLAYMAKRFCFTQEDPERYLFRGALGTVVRIGMIGSYCFDELFVNHTRIGDWLGGMCIITLGK